MSKKYLKYYDGLSATASLRFLFDMIITKSPNRKFALQNRAHDYGRVVKNPDLLPLHKKMHQRICNAAALRDVYDYGEGYFYQSYERIGVTGFRDTEARVASMDLEKWVRGKRVLEIGCNSGFLSLQIASYAAHVVGFDIMDHLIGIAEDVSKFVGANNVNFMASSFEDFHSSSSFDVILSFANHSTYDGQTRNSIEEYFDRCHRLCSTNGLLLFESHPPEYEGNGLKGVIQEIEKRFNIMENCVLEYGDNALDQGRTFIVAKKKSKITDEVC